MLFYSIPNKRLLEVVVVVVVVQCWLPASQHHSSPQHRPPRRPPRRPAAHAMTFLRQTRRLSNTLFLSRVQLVVAVVLGLLLSLCWLQISLSLVHAGFHQQTRYHPFFAFSKLRITTTWSAGSTRLSLSGPYYAEISNIQSSSSSGGSKNHFELASPGADRHDDDATTNAPLIMNSGDKNDQDQNQTRTHCDVSFLSPLLKYGYRPAVDEYENGRCSKSDDKPLLLYLPGFDGTFVAPFLQFPELGTIFEVQCMTMSTSDRSTFDELKEAVVNHLMQETSNFEQRQQQRRRLERLEKKNQEKQQQQTLQQQQSGGGGGWFGLFGGGRSKSSTESTDSTTSNSSNNKSSISSSGVFNLFGWWPSGNTAVSNTTTTTTTTTTTVAGTVESTVNKAVSSSSSRSVNKGTTSIKNYVKVGPSRPIYLAGESFGGILACEVALELLAKQHQQHNKHPEEEECGVVKLQGLALINPATCYDRSRLAVEAPIVAEQYHPFLYPLALATKVLPLFLDEYSMAQLLLILQAKALPSVIDNAMREAYMGRVAFSLPFVLPYIDQSALRWRLKEWLEVGCERMAFKLKDFQKYSRTTPAGGSSNSNSNFRPLPILIVAGEKDSALPSIAEAERLSSILPKTFLHVVEGAGHSSTCGSRVDLAALFRATYPELRKPPSSSTKGKGRNNDKKTSSKATTNTTSTLTSVNSNRISMKKVAAAGKNEYFGMEPRYDNSTTIGLSPLLYWSEDFYRKFRPQSSQEAATVNVAEIDGNDLRE
jgi:pimeloyl-ACP methyl ester carboxylesterase